MCNITGDVIRDEMAALLMSALIIMMMIWNHGLLDARVLGIAVMAETQGPFLAFGLKAGCWV